MNRMNWIMVNSLKQDQVNSASFLLMVWSFDDIWRKGGGVSRDPQKWLRNMRTPYQYWIPSSKILQIMNDSFLLIFMTSYNVKSFYGN